MAEMDFPLNPTVGQKYTNSIGVVYEWTGVAWIIGFYSSGTQVFDVLGDVVAQVRTLLQDTDTLGGEYRYSDDSIVTAINQGMLEMLRIRPDIFLYNGFTVPAFTTAEPSAPMGIEPQFVPSLVYYAVGMCQLRDDEGTEDERASMFLAKFTSTLVSVA